MAIRESCESGGMADALDLGSSGETRGGSNPPFRTPLAWGFPEEPTTTADLAILHGVLGPPTLDVPGGYDSDSRLDYA